MPSNIAVQSRLPTIFDNMHLFEKAERQGRCEIYRYYRVVIFNVPPLSCDHFPSLSRPFPSFDYVIGFGRRTNKREKVAFDTAIFNDKIQSSRGQ